MANYHLENKELEVLMDCGWDLPQEVIDTFDQLPRESFSKDLISIIRFFIDQKEVETLNFDNEDLSIIHAIFLMAHYRFEEGLEVILELWSLDEDYLNLFFGDIINEEGWFVLYHLSQNQIDLLVKFILNEQIDAFNRIAASSALSILAINKEELRDPISKAFEEILTSFNSIPEDSNNFDSTLIAFVISDVVDAGFKDLFVFLEQLYAKRYVDFGVNGNFEELIKRVEEFGPTITRSPKRTILEIYSYFNSSFNPDSYKII